MGLPSARLPPGVNKPSSPEGLEGPQKVLVSKKIGEYPRADQGDEG